MKWINHVAIAGATTAVIAPPLVPLAILGSTAPDWLEWVFQAFGNRVKHRTVTHILVYWLFSMLFFMLIWDYHGIGSAFCYGGLTHVLADSLTVTGVPFSPLSDRRFHLFGGRLKTGQPGEFMVSGGIIVVCFFLGSAIHSTTGSFIPFFYDWAGHYESGLIDGSEWKTNRFKFL